MATATNSSAVSDTEYEMVKNIFNNEKLENLKINIKELEKLMWSECSIYRVPSNLREVKEEAYTPQLISIGPLHYGRKELHPMQELKVKYLGFFRKRVSNDQALQRFKNGLEGKEKEIRNCYAQKFPDIGKDEFVELILLDAVFIMEHFLRIHSECKAKNEVVKGDSESFRSTHRDDYVLTQSWLSRSIHRDLLLLENQIPMFVLKDLYKSVPPGDKQGLTFLDLAFEYFSIYCKCSSDETKQNLKVPELSTGLKNNKSLGKLTKLKELEEQKQERKHFTDLIRYFYLPTKLESCEHSPASVIRTVTKLREAGVSFEKAQGRSCLLDIEFEKKPILSWFLCLGCIPCFKYFKARVIIPQLKVDHATECVFRNLIAFEQCHYPLQPYICNYVSVLDSLIHTKDDVELLLEKEVIVHELGSDKEVATLVNGLCKHVVAHTTCYFKFIDDITKHYQNTWYHYMAALRLVYFRDPWRASGTVVGIAVLVFTIFNFWRVSRVLF